MIERQVLNVLQTEVDLDEVQETEISSCVSVKECSCPYMLHLVASSCHHQGMFKRSFAGADLLDLSTSSISGRHIHGCARSFARVSSSSPTTCLPMFGKSLNV